MAIESLAALSLAKEVVGGHGTDKEIAERLSNEANENARLAQQLNQIETLSQTENFRISDFERNEIANRAEIKNVELASANELNNKIQHLLENNVREVNEEPEFYSSLLERINQTTNDINKVEWTGERGNSESIPKEPDMKNLLEKFDQESVSYNNDGIPDFSPFSRANVEIDNMSANRTGPEGNFAQADEKLAEQFNADKFNGRKNWTSSDVRNWRREDLKNETGMQWSWHEEPDRKTCRLIPTDINAYFGHLGGVGECKIRDRESITFNNSEVKFDA